MATKDEVLQKVTDYCTEKQYTLNEDFRSQYSEKYAANYAEADVNNEAVLKDIKFHLDTAFAAASKTAKTEAESWKAKEAEYKKQIDEFKKQNPQETKHKSEKKEVELPDDVKKQLEEFNEFKVKQQKQEKIAKVFNLAKENVREDLHEELKQIMDIMTFNDSDSESEMANKLTAKFTDLWKNKIGNIKPQSPILNNKKYDELLNNAPKVNVY